MTEKISTVTIAGKEYPKPHMDHMNRGQIRNLKPLLSKLNEDQDVDVLWDVIGAFFPDVPQDDVDAIGLGEAKSLLSAAGVAKFDDEPADKDKEESEPAEITVGESSASANS